MMFKAFETKMNDAVEKRDRMLTKQLRNTFEESQKLIAATQSEEKTPWWKNFSLKFRRNLRQCKTVKFTEDNK
ncbi:hypothetical protein [Lysinibacillus sphaericus]|uniref:hypothetical protein n=1 Tax=Lysinibacillus sphaericus TaxID=1421 RepID=UPI003CFF0F00